MTLAITKLLSIKEAKGHHKERHLKDSIRYIISDEKTGGGRYVSAVNCQPAYAYQQMKSTKELFHKTDKRQGYHIIISFDEGEVTPEKAFEIIGKFVDEYLKGEYEAVYAVHDNTEHIHGHIIFNSVSYLTGKKYRYEKGDWGRDIQPVTNRLCEEYGLSTIKIDQDKTSDPDNYKEWEKRQDEFLAFSDMIRRDIDACIIQADDFEWFIRLMNSKGYMVKQGKYLAVKPPGMKRYRRTKFFGEDYTEQGIRRRIKEESFEISRGVNTARIVKVNIPYHIRRAKLTGLQRRYFAKLYRTGKLLKTPYSQAWKYKDDIKQMNKLHEEYMFLAENEIHSMEEVENIKNTLIEERKALDEKRRAFYKERDRFKDLKEVSDRMTSLTPAEISYQSGDTFFKKEHDEFVMLQNRMSDVGYSPEEIAKISLYYRERAAQFIEDYKKLNKKLKIAQRLLDGESKKLTRDKDINETKHLKIKEKTRR